MSQDDSFDSDLLVEPTGTGVTSANAIVEIDAHLEENHVDHPAYTPPEVTPEELGIIADALAELAQLEESAKIEILRRHFQENDRFVPRFTAGELTELVISLAICRTTYLYEGETIAVPDAILSFGRLVKESEQAPLDGKWENLQLEGIEPAPDQGDHIDPFKAIAGDQLLLFSEDE